MKMCSHCNGPIQRKAWQRPYEYAATVFCSRSCSSKSRTIPLEQRLNKFLSKPSDTECWEWNGARHRKGYGFMPSVVLGEVLAHRIAWIVWRGAIPAGLHVCHRCDNTPCCNPAHLFLGSNLDNHHDKMAKGRQRGAQGELNSKAKLTAEDIALIREAQGSQTDIAERFGVTQTTVSAIKVGRTWKHIPRRAA